MEHDFEHYQQIVDLFCCLFILRLGCIPCWILCSQDSCHRVFLSAPHCVLASLFTNFRRLLALSFTFFHKQKIFWNIRHYRWLLLGFKLLKMIFIFFIFHWSILSKYRHETIIQCLIRNLKHAYRKTISSFEIK